MPVPKNHFKRTNIDTKKITYRDGMMFIPTDLGYNIDLEMDLEVSLDPTVFSAGTPIFNINPILKKATVKPTPKALSDNQIITKLKKDKIIPEKMIYDDFLIGFIYSSPQDINNHKWMFQMRKNKQIFSSIQFLGVDVDCPVSTFSWHDSIYHGRFLIDKKDLIDVQETEWGHVKVIGKQPEGVDGDTSIIPEGTTHLRIRYNIMTDLWYIDWLDKIGKQMEGTIEFRSFVCTAPMKGVADYNHPKPWVSMWVDVNNIGQMQKMGEYVIINRKKS